MRRGYTLAEAMIASVVLSISVIGISATLSASYRQSNVCGNNNSALALAQQLMEEIASKPIDVPSGTTDQPGWSGGQTNRALYDNVGDYNGYTDTGGSVTTSTGATVDLGDGGTYTRTVSVTSNAMPPGYTAYGQASDFLLVTVTVSMPHSQSISLSQMFTRTTLYR